MSLKTNVALTSKKTYSPKNPMHQIIQDLCSKQKACRLITGTPGSLTLEVCSSSEVCTQVCTGRLPRTCVSLKLSILATLLRALLQKAPSSGQVCCYNHRSRVWNREENTHQLPLLAAQTLLLVIKACTSGIRVLEL